MDLKKLKETVKKEYFSISKVYSPALSDYIYFTSEGFHHLTYKNQLKGRSRKEKFERLMHFKYVRKLIQITSEIQELRTVIYNMNYNITFLAIESDINSIIRIRVIIKRYDKNGKFLFLSVIPIMKKC